MSEQERVDELVDAIIDYETACGSLEETTAEGYARLFLGSSVLREMRAEAWDEGWRTAWSPLAMHSLNDGPNPYCEAAE